MPSTGVLNGTTGVIQVGGTTVAHLKTNGFEISHAVRDATSKDSAGWTDNLEGLRSWTMSGECYFAEDAAYGYEDLFDAVNARTLLTIKLTTDVTGDMEYTGTAYVTSVSRTDPNEESSSYSVSFTGSGAITKATVT